MEQWSGLDALAQMSGTSAELPPIRIMFLAHRVSASGHLWMTRGVEIRAIEVFEGEIVGCSGFRNLIGDLEGERQWSISDWVDPQVSAGTAAEQALSNVAVALCVAALCAHDDGDWMIQFVPSKATPTNISAIPQSLGQSMAVAIRESIADTDVRRWLEDAANNGIVAYRPVDSPIARWGLDAIGLRLLEVAESNPSVGTMFVEIGTDGWGPLGVLWKLGLVGLAAPKMEPEERREPPPSTASEERRQPPPSTASAPLNQPDPKSESAPRVKAAKARRRPDKGRGEKPSSGAPAKKKRRLDPRVVAIRRNPANAGDPQRQELQLKEAHDVLKSVRPEFIYRLKKSEDLERGNIERRHREACARYHPDRYRKANQGTRSLAEGCFTLVADAFHKLEEPTYLEALRVRLVERETGVKVVTDQTRARAQVDHAKAEVLFKQKRFSDALGLASKAIEGNPEPWQYRYLYFRAGYRSGSMKLDDVARGILGLQGMTTIEKADQISVLGEICLKEGEEARAYKLFRQAASLDDKNVVAIRRLRLRNRREQGAQDTKPGGGLFGGLFQRRK